MNSEEKEKDERLSREKDIVKEKEKEEIRFCTPCKLYQPYRTKHCRECQKCVALYDHHCPWIGGCVGQNNRIYFF